MENNVPEKRITVHQQMMDKAYELWNDCEESKKLSYEDFLSKVNDELGKEFVYAVMTGNMNYQVENGGWQQWDDNGYSCTLGDITEFFDKEFFEDVPEAKQLLKILDDFEELFDIKQRAEKAIEQIDYDVRDIFEDAMNDALLDWFQRESGRLDKQYYKINDKISEALEKYFFQKSLDEINGESNK
jgi:hypothetical protein